MLSRNWLAPTVLLAAIVAVALIGPEEATLGSGIRWVYLHVAFVWSGALMITALGLAGLVMIIRPTDSLASWFFAGESVGVGLFGAGFILSLISAATSWGAVLWQEPRVISSFVVVGAGVSAVLLIRSLDNPRWIGLIAAALFVLVTYTLVTTGRVFHPDNPIGTSESLLIKTTFFGLAGLALAFGLSLLPVIGRVPEPEGS